MGVMTDKEIKRSIASVKVSQAVEGLDVNKRSIVLGTKFMREEITSQDAVESLKEYLIGCARRGKTTKNN